MRLYKTLHRPAIPRRSIDSGEPIHSAKKVFEIVREFPEGEIRITSEDGGWVRLEMGRARFKVMSLPKEDFPTVPQIEGGEICKPDPQG